MQENNVKDNLETEVDTQPQQTENQAGSEEAKSQHTETELNDETTVLRAQLQEMKDKYLRQVAEFDNFRKRNAKERLEMIQTAGKEVILSLLEVLDDCERAEKQLERSEDVQAVKDGVSLVFNKLKGTLQGRGLKPMDTIGAEFNPDHHEAITEIPAPTEEMKGKVIDEVEKGYYLNDKIIRFAKVVVGK